MQFNNVNFEAFAMKVNAFTYQPLTASIPIFQPDISIWPLIGNVKLEPKPMNFIAEFKSKIALSNFMAHVLSHKENVIDMDEGYIYHCYLDGSSAPVEEYWRGWYRLTLSFLVVQTGIEQLIKLEKGQNILKILGNWQTNCIYEITSAIDKDIFTIADITIKNLKANRTLTIDGISKRIYTSEGNAYGDVQLPKNMFPIIYPGMMKIPLDNDDIVISLRYYPLFV